MLTKNIWQTKGLYNGALGTVRGIVYADGALPPSLPRFVLVEFNDYRGPRIDPARNMCHKLSNLMHGLANLKQVESNCLWFWDGL